MDAILNFAGAMLGSKGSNPPEDAQPEHENAENESRAADQPVIATGNRFESFFRPCTGQAKWFVDGCSYFWAVAEALEQAQESIMIMDWWLSPEVYLRRPPALNEQYRLDVMLKAAAERGVQVRIIVYKEVEAALTLNSEHTKRVLEELHPNIRVFRHPDHAPSGTDLKAEISERLEHLTNLDLAKASGDVVESLYGRAKDVVLFWAHHEKLLIVDQRQGFMGGLDLCFGRWDTNSHPIADAHPGNLDAIMFPGQDFNNARVYDFADVQEWSRNKLDRTKSSRMGWSDVALSLSGPIVVDLVSHFTDRWNFIFDDKYSTFDDQKYEKMFDTTPTLIDELSVADQSDVTASQIQLVRSCSEWSSGHDIEHSIFNAYVDTIKNAKHFVYIENQFFITATGSEQKTVANLIGAAIVERICRAFEAGEPFKVIVVMPAVPAFAGDLRSDDALGTRAILEFQYYSICRGGHSILEKLHEAGIEDAGEYIGFYNLRNYDRINTSETMEAMESNTGISYEAAREEQDNYMGSTLGHSDAGDVSSGERSQYQQYQSQVEDVTEDVLDTVSSCYMDGGCNIVNTTWRGDPDKEIDAFVSEELYIHSKLLIADDRIVICGSANLNDRSQLGDHDSEIAVIIEDLTSVDSVMNGESYTASRFAASLRRHIFRKHLGLLPHQRCDQPDVNWLPIDKGGNEYDWDSLADVLVRDPLHPDFDALWRGTAKTNTEVFSRAFHPVPNNCVRTWDDYKDFYARHFRLPSGEKPKSQGEDGSEAVAEVDAEHEGEDEETRYDYGHIVREEFPAGIDEVKTWLGWIKGTLVEMPLEFLAGVEDIAKDRLTLNDLTDKLYT